MKHVLIQESPLALVMSVRDGFKPRRIIVEGQEVRAPQGCRYVPDLPLPEYDPATHSCERVLTLESYGWMIRDLTEEELAARQPEIAGVTKLTIMRRLGPKWATLKGLLGQLSEEAQDAWGLAQEIRIDDPLIVAGRATFEAVLELSAEQFEALLTP